MTHQQILADIGVAVPDILLPAPGADLRRWAVVACDQFTSQPEYWSRLATEIGDAPSTLHLIYPEVYLGEPDPGARIARINDTMRSYLERGLLQTLPESFILVRRQSESGAVRWGLMVAIDLEAYDYSPGSRSLVRATEGTILDRIPPRKRIRQDAPLELPHIMVLISDPGLSVIEPLTSQTDRLTQVYDTDLVAGGGHITGWAVSDPADLAQVAQALAELHRQLDPANPLLFAMGDGNHSLATAKSCWEDVKAGLDEAERAQHPARYALVELENIFDPGLDFEPIHRVLFATSRDAFETELARHCAGFVREPVPDLDTLLAALETTGEQAFGTACGDELDVYVVQQPQASIAAGTLQRVIDALAAEGHEVDYIHGADVTAELAGDEANLGLFLPEVSKKTFFASLVADGALPRKTFSIGQAAEKRYYLEARAIR
ncbi:MAG: DUF1015 domain-containing protein [Actinomycetia bacterium]|nr:DUF1015 domain-containing protein [Actinomycetes bacterium]